MLCELDASLRSSLNGYSLQQFAMLPSITPIVVLQQSQGIVNTRPLCRETYCTHLRAMGEIFVNIASFFQVENQVKQTWFNHNQVANMALHVLSLSPLFSWLTTVNLPWRSRRQWIWSEKLWVLKDTPSHYPNHLRWFISHITCKVCNHFNVQGSLSSHSSIEMIPPKVVFVSRKNLQNPRHSNGQDIAVV